MMEFLKEVLPGVLLAMVATWGIMAFMGLLVYLASQFEQKQLNLALLLLLQAVVYVLVYAVIEVWRTTK